MIKIIKQEMVLVSSPMKRKQKLVSNLLAKDIVVRVFNLEGKSHQIMANFYSKENVVGKTQRDSTIQK